MYGGGEHSIMLLLHMEQLSYLPGTSLCPQRADEVNAQVIDLGSCTAKAGYAGEDTPKALFPSVSPFQAQQGAGSGPDSPGS
jgi:hypothetical protein